MSLFELSILMPARNEAWLGRTITDCLEHSSDCTEVIVVCDGYWPDVPIEDHPRLTVIHHENAIGQRQSTNLAAKLSRSKYIAKFDAHCSFADGFDVALMADCEYDWTVIPRMYNLHVFDWVCGGCGQRTYQGGKPDKCESCGGEQHEMDMLWKPRMHKLTDFGRFDDTLHFRYWRDYRKRPEASGDISDVMCAVGAGWFMHRDRYWELGGMDERHGSWGQMGVEVACKAWLSGGRQVVNKKTWFAHLFRTQPGFGFPYKMSQGAVDRAREYSRTLWRSGEWDRQVRPLEWLIEHFKPVPGWDHK